MSDGVDGGSATVGPRTALEAVRKLVTVLFCDVVGSTTLAERLDPEALGGLMMTHFSRMEEIIVSHGGVVEKYVGDAVLAVFGYPSVHEDDAVRACRAAVDMRDALRQLNERFEATWGVRLETRTGVNTGEVVAAAPTRDQTLPLGDPANVAARLQTAAPPGEIYLGESTWRLVRQLVRAEPVRTLVLKGKTEPVAAWRLIEVASPGAAWPEPAGSVFAGRDAEMESLGSAFDACLLDRTCHLVTVIGEPGVGKSRLALEFVRGLGRRASVLRARCLSYGQGITFWPLAEIVKQAAGIGEREGPEAAVAALDRVLVDRSDRARIVGPLASAIGWRETAFPIEEVFWAARTALEHLAGAGPLAVVFDDIHWAEERFLELLDHVATNVRGVPLFVLCLARPDLFERSDRAAGLAEHQVIRLQPLSEEATARMAEGVLGTSHLPTGVERSVAEASEGNPLFVEQLLELWQERGALVRSNGSWDLTADPGALEVPPTIRSLLDSRLDLLSTEHRSLLERAAVIGQVFRREGLLELADRPASVVDETLGDLMAKAFIDPHRESSAPEPSYRFHHVLLRDAAYGSTLKSRRAVLHERFGRWLRDNVGSRLTEYEELIGFHHERAYRYLIELGARDEHAEAVAREAFDLLASAGRRAHDREDSTAAVNLLSRAAALLPDRDPARLDLLPDLGEALEDAGELAEADSVLREAIDAATEAGEDVLRARAMVSWVYVQAYLPPARTPAFIRQHVEPVLPILEAAGDHRTLARAWHHLTVLSMEVEGDLDAAAAMQRRSIDHAQRAGDLREEASGRYMLCALSFWGATPVPEAIALCLETLAWMEGTPGTDGGAARVLRALGELEAMAGRFEFARAHLAQSASILERLGARGSWAATLIHAGEVEIIARQPEEAERILRRAAAASGPLGLYGLGATARLAEAILMRGEVGEADRLSAASIGFRDTDRENAATWGSVRARVLARLGRLDEAEALARGAVEAVEAFDFLRARAIARRALAEVLQAAGRVDEAREEFEVALALHERKADVAGAAQVREAMALLS